jgi:hypothetical protein
MAELLQVDNKIVSKLIPVAFEEIQMVARENRVCWNIAHWILLMEIEHFRHGDQKPYALAVQIANERLNELLNDNQYDE